jgi:tetratricopeptide (TPR) repeat protein
MPSVITIGNSRVHLPETLAASYIEDARRLRELGRFDDAEALFREAMRRFPDDSAVRSEYAWLAQIARDWHEAVGRWQEMRTRHPDSPVGYSVGAAALRELKRLDEAEDLLTEAITRFPADAAVIIEYARIAEARLDWAAATARWELVRARVPEEIEGYASAGTALARQGLLEQAETVLREGMERIPSSLRLCALFAEIATTRNDWHQAFSRWSEAQRRFPESREFAARVFEARLRLCEIDPDAASVIEDGIAERDPVHGEMYEIMMAFESLGHGCEFGGVQREFGAEPLGLLRWGAISPENLITALGSGFAGVGVPEHTELSLRPNGKHSEYWVADRRFGMEMHTFISQEQISFERMFAQSCRRMEFLSRKLLEDLKRADKIFVYKLDHRDLTDREIFGLFDALGQYGETTLLCVRKENDHKWNGLVEIVKPGLMVAYIDRFAEQQADGRLSVPTASWAAICREAYTLWRSGAAKPPLDENVRPVIPPDVRA